MNINKLNLCIKKTLVFIIILSSFFCVRLNAKQFKSSIECNSDKISTILTGFYNSLDGSNKNSGNNKYLSSYNQYRGNAEFLQSTISYCRDSSFVTAGLRFEVSVKNETKVTGSGTLEDPFIFFDADYSITITNYENIKNNNYTVQSGNCVKTNNGLLIKSPGVTECTIS